MNAQDALLSVSDLHVAYGAVEAVAGVSLAVPSGAIVSVIGPNGAGKSTLLNALMGLLPGTGAIRFDGADLAGLPTESRLRRGVCLVAEKRELFSEMSVADNLALGAFWRRHQNRTEVAADLDAAYERFPRLRERQRQLAGTLSGGERQMLAIARALMARPRLLMLDEPSLGLAPLIVAEVLETVAALRRSGVSILIVEQNARAVLRIADYGYVLEGGRVAMEGRAEDLLNDQRLIDAYLGLGHASDAAADV